MSTVAATVSSHSTATTITSATPALTSFFVSSIDPPWLDKISFDGTEEQQCRARLCENEPRDHCKATEHDDLCRNDLDAHCAEQPVLLLLLPLRSHRPSLSPPLCDEVNDDVDESKRERKDSQHVHDDERHLQPLNCSV